MSTLKVNTIQDASGNNPSTAAQIAQGRAKAWVNFDGTFETSPFTENNGGIRDSFNVSSVVDEGTGLYTINFATAMSDTNYCEIGSSSNSGSAFGAYLVPMADLNSSYPRTAAKFSIFTGSYNALQDVAYNFVAVFGEQ